MSYHKPQILDPSVPGGDSVREAIDKNDDNVDYLIDAINNHDHDGDHGVPIAPGALPDTIAYLTGANFTGDVQGPKIWARDSLGTLGTLRMYDLADQTVFAEGEMNGGIIRLVKKDSTGVVPGLKMRINDEEVPTASYFIDVSTGPTDGGKGVKLNPSGKIDATMLEVGGLIFIGSWTPTAGAEYPDTTGIEYGSFWMISGVDSVNGYTFTGGDLAGQTAYNSDTLLWGNDGWLLKTVSVDPDMYYRLDGVSPITADFQAGGFKLVNVAEPTTDTDAATKFYVDTHGGGGGGGINPINEPQPGDFARFVTDVTQEGVTTSELEDMLDFFKTTEFIHASTGAADAFKPVTTSPTGYLDKSLLDISVFYFVSSFTPTEAQEYPDTTGEMPGAFWDVEGTHVDDGYTFTTGDLMGQTAHNGDLMMWGSGGWALRQSNLEPEMFYRLDGAYSLTAPFAGGGHQLKNISDGSDDADAITKRQLDAHDHTGVYLPITGTAADSALLGGEPKEYFATATHNHDTTYARLDGATFVGNVTINNNFNVGGDAIFDNIPSTNGAPVYDNDLATKIYVDTIAGGGGDYLPLTGGTLTGSLYIDGGNFEATGHGYFGTFLIVESDLTVNGSGYFASIPSTGGTPVNASDLVTKSYVDSIGGTPGQYLEVDGDNMEGPLSVAGVYEDEFNSTSSSLVVDLTQFSVVVWTVPSGGGTMNITGVDPSRCNSFVLILGYGSNGVNWPSDVRWVNGGTEPDWSTTNAIVFVRHTNDSYWYGYNAGELW